jgi:hypothetical protein
MATPDVRNPIRKERWSFGCDFLRFPVFGRSFPCAGRPETATNEARNRTPSPGKTLKPRQQLSVSPFGVSPGGPRSHHPPGFCANAFLQGF